VIDHAIIPRYLTTISSMLLSAQTPAGLEYDGEIPFLRVPKAVIQEQIKDMLTDPFYKDVTVAIVDAENFELAKHLSLNNQLVQNLAGRRLHRLPRFCWRPTKQPKFGNAIKNFIEVNGARGRRNLAIEKIDVMQSSVRAVTNCQGSWRYTG
jgi:hypothetical protein